MLGLDIEGLPAFEQGRIVPIVLGEIGVDLGGGAVGERVGPADVGISSAEAAASVGDLAVIDRALKRIGVGAEHAVDARAGLESPEGVVRHV